MEKIDNLADLIKEYPEMKSPLLDAVVNVLSKMHKAPLPFALELMLAYLIYRQSSGDTCIRTDADSINSFFKEKSEQKKEQEERFEDSELSGMTDMEDPDYSEEKAYGDKFENLIYDQDIKDVLNNCSDLIGRDESSDKPLIFDSALGRLYIRRNYCYEIATAKFVKEASRKSSDLNLDKEEINTVKSLLDLLFQRLDPEIIKKYPTDMQKVAAAMAVASHFCIITGGPGTGKTTTVAKLLLLLQKIAPSKSNILLCAPTGKAAGRMTDSVKSQFEAVANPTPGSCYYGFLKLFPDEKVREEIKGRICKTAVTVDKLLGSIPHKAHKIRNSENKLACDILIVDEVSMVDAANFAKLCEAIHEKTKVIMLGDKDQLASVEAGSVLNDLCHDLTEASKDVDDKKLSFISDLTGYTLDEIKKSAVSANAVQLNYSYRFSRFIGICTLANVVNDAYKKALSNGYENYLHDPFKKYDEQVEFKELLDSHKYRERRDNLDSLCSAIVGGFENYWEGLAAAHVINSVFTGITAEQAKNIFELLDEYRILCSNREGLYGIQSINDKIELLVRNKLKKINTNAGSIDSEWFIGKVILITKNNYALKLSNGDVGFVAAEKKADGSAGPLKVWFGNKENVFNVSPVFLTEFDKGYAMTIHKSQGSEYKNVCMILSTRLNPVMTKELVYTGITRAKEHVLIYSAREVFNAACGRRVLRESGLTERL